ncbi:MAG: UDP-N-acetylmuramoyl-L-alanine--D-glutamate ligase [Candidatus Levybacteria bacterium CG_4_10_14_0_8_um_filter_35_23]|nr:MAG: UDP-N-acetylmuramoyl-L-alanine--D-glutamate ligase [Candidatus Levybacteria bacterium CG_4_10_14_0_8_um_filter_35_23]
MNLNFNNKRVAIVGAGTEGLSNERFLKEKGANVTVLDQKQGEDYLKDLEGYDLVVRSPGVKLSKIKNKKSPLRQGFEGQANLKESQITSQTKLFFDFCPCKIIGVTGTKGKGTTSALIYEMLKKQGKDAYLVGNIGSPALDILDKLNDQSIVVYELSSFQLQDLEKSPHIAIMLMTVPEHLDYHKNIEEYVDAKRNIFRFQKPEDFAILNQDYPASNESDIHTGAKIFKVSREKELLEDGACIKDGKVWLKVSMALKSHSEFDDSSDASVPAKLGTRSPSVTLMKTSSLRNAPRANISKENFESSPRKIAIIDVRDILLPGAHNLENVCAAVIAASLCGVSTGNIAAVLKTFKGLEHRLELVDTIYGVKYYDDSFSTTPETAIAAIQAFEGPKILILGGSSKNSDFTELGRVIRDSENVKAVIGIGKEWGEIRSKIKNEKVKIIEGCRNMKEIALAAFDAAETGDIVLLSPACASFGMFKNYKDRGEQFKSEVLRLRTSSNF